MKHAVWGAVFVVIVSASRVACAQPAPKSAPTAPPGPPAIQTVPGMPPVVDPKNLYSETAASKLSDVAKNALPRVYVPNIVSNDVYVIDPATFKVVDRFRVGVNPQHVVPSWDLKTLWVANNAENTTKGSLTPIDPRRTRERLALRTVPVATAVVGNASMRAAITRLDMAAERCGAARRDGLHHTPL